MSGNHFTNHKYEFCGLSEYNIEMMMKLTAALNLPCYCKPQSWVYSKDKALFKEECKKAGVQVPTDYYVDGENLEQILKNVKYPVVVKPVDQNGNRGVSYCYDEKDLLEAVKLARESSRSDKLIIEKLIRGEESAACTPEYGREIIRVLKEVI